MGRGSNSNGVRRYNERLVLSTIRRLDGASKADLAKITGLSPQAALRIVEDLEADGLLMVAGRRTGGMGQPSTIYKINGENGYTIGVEVGRNRLTCVLLNFNGVVLATQTRPMAFPERAAVIAEIAEFARVQLAALGPEQREAFLGVGIAMPWFIGAWREEIGVTPDQAREWGADVEEAFRSGLDCPVFFENDGNSAALAELLCGVGLGVENYLYFHVGTFVGGGLVLGGQIHQGRHGNAAALASMPIPDEGGQDFLLHRASLYSLEAALGQGNDEAVRAAWLDACAQGIAFVILGANSLLDLDAVVLSGAMDETTLQALARRVEARMAATAPKDFFKPNMLVGQIRDTAPAVGAGLLPLYASYTPNLGSLLKGDAA
ncbi:ROK family protein [Caulobacter sp. CCNWLY153]|uniref:ROK family transcriptional regulator n=1 Tax=Caulobacter radicis TaxID=2172650 RepID=A0A2T9JIK6_9CAUL|nr:ROK family transcriptional regulator [Caulobacter radicis]PVM79406.1 ROK family transcriptional regulator [Caulobacter radicis]PVM83535.1 ROK family transcriptional regulator [Caulobacter radicis]